MNKEHKIQEELAKVGNSILKYKGTIIYFYEGKQFHPNFINIILMAWGTSYLWVIIEFVS